MSKQAPSIQEAFLRNITRIGAPHAYLRDLYAALMRTSWLGLLAFFVAAYLLVNVAFAALYLVAGDAIANARAGSFEDAFAFSFQTLSTVGYGALSPTAPWGNVIASAEVFLGIILAAMATGVVFAKISRPRAGIAFSRKAVMGPRNGTNCLMLRLANTRGSEVVEASIRLSAIRAEVTAEGHRLRRVIDLAVERTTTPVFLLSWLVIHRIDAASPFHGLTAEALRTSGMRIIANVTGIDGAFMQTVYAYSMYDAADIVYGAHFQDMVHDLPGGRTVVDLSKLDEVKTVTSEP